MIYLQTGAWKSWSRTTGRGRGIQGMKGRHRERERETEIKGRDKGWVQVAFHSFIIYLGLVDGQVQLAMLKGEECLRCI